MRKVRIAQIGINQYSHGYDIFETLRALSDVFDIAGYALVEDEREVCRDKLGIFDGFPELTLAEILADPTIEAVAVETDEVHLAKYAHMAAEAGKHVHMEKPGSPDAAAFDALTRTFEASGAVFHLGYMYRYHPFIADAVERAACGALGDIFAVEAQMSRRDGETVRRWLAELPGGMMYYLGCHLLDIVLRAQGMPEQILPLSRPTEEGFGDDYGMAALVYKNGVSFIKACGVECGGGERRQLVINGRRGSIEIRPLEIRLPGEGYLFCSEKTETLVGTPRRAFRSEPFDRYIPMMRAFAEMVRGERTNTYTPAYERMLHNTLLVCCGVHEYKKYECLR